MQPIDLSFRFEDNGRFHDDLVLQLGDRHWRCDSYYLLIDDATMPEPPDASKVRAVLRRLFDQWSAAVAGLSDGQACYLPFDFSDEYTGWLRCRAEGMGVADSAGLVGLRRLFTLALGGGGTFENVAGFPAGGR